ncbi:hypothetical protein HK096_001011 [Nowakowskiella sp. JEL0078]|nr:hypothetical protein HK096_001011 [Nowakowskiella sp. JEL0078]
MSRISFVLLVLALVFSSVIAAPVLPAEVQAVKDSLVGKITRNNAVKLPVTGFADFISGAVHFSTIDVNAQSEDPLVFALKKFATAAVASSSSAATKTFLSDSLNVYLADEIAIRESTNAKVQANLNKIKIVKFFLQFQQARIANNAAEITHQRAKVVKNSPKSPASAITALNALK